MLNERNRVYAHVPCFSTDKLLLLYIHGAGRTDMLRRHQFISLYADGYRAHSLVSLPRYYHQKEYWVPSFLQFKNRSDRILKVLYLMKVPECAEIQSDSSVQRLATCCRCFASFLYFSGYYLFISASILGSSHPYTTLSFCNLGFVSLPHIKS
jgi:hypothetical protein